jgi:uncharacterized protein (TIGR03083 family)
MDLSTHIQALSDEGRLLADSVVDFDTPVPTCPGWTVRDLVRHVGEVHVWARSHVAEARQAVNTDAASLMTWPGDDDAALIDWFRDGHAALVETLEKADPDLDCFAFLPGPRGTRFWARRQAHETTVHRVDAQSATGSVTPVRPELAADGVDEILHGFFARRPSRFLTPQPHCFVLHADDVDRSWSVTLGPEGPSTVDGESGTAEARVSAPANDLYLLLWNRRPLEGLDLQGDRAVLDRWRENATIQWR